MEYVFPRHQNVMQSNFLIDMSPINPNEKQSNTRFTVRYHPMNNKQAKLDYSARIAEMESCTSAITPSTNSVSMLLVPQLYTELIVPEGYPAMLSLIAEAMTLSFCPKPMLSTCHNTPSSRCFSPKSLSFGIAPMLESTSVFSRFSPS